MIPAYSVIPSTIDPNGSEDVFRDAIVCFRTRVIGLKRGAFLFLDAKIKTDLTYDDPFIFSLLMNSLD